MASSPGPPPSASRPGQDPINPLTMSEVSDLSMRNPPKFADLREGPKTFPATKTMRGPSFYRGLRRAVLRFGR